jgi:hypothetical protein
VVVLAVSGITRPGSTASAQPGEGMGGPMPVRIFGFYGVGAIPEQTEIPDGESVPIEARCRPGDAVTGGGYSTTSVTTGFLVTRNGPFSATTWRVTVDNQSGGPITFRVTARCADITPPVNP